MADTTPTDSTAGDIDDPDEIRALVDAAPPLSVRQQEQLRLIFGGARYRTADPARKGDGRSVNTPSVPSVTAVHRYALDVDDSGQIHAGCLDPDTYRPFP